MKGSALILLGLPVLALAHSGPEEKPHWSRRKYQAQKSSSANATSASTSASSTSTASSLSTTSTSSSSSSSLTPNGIKAGISAGDAYDVFKNYIGWWYDWTPAPSGHSGTPIAVSMLWGDGQVDSQDASRYAEFQALTTTPKYVLGFEEPDCTTAGSAGMSVATSATTWNNLIAPMGAKGALLGSPAMCKQADEDFLTPFKALITRDWDFTAVHINKVDMAGVKKDLDHYWNTYGKPIWVTEFACVDDTTWTPCTDQTQINTYINDIVALFQSDSRVHAYAFSNGEGLGSVWPMWSNGALTASGQTYLNAIKSYA